MKKLLSFLLVFVLVMSMAAPTLAVVPGDDAQTEQAKELLTTYSQVITDESGIKTTIRFQFHTEDALNEAAAYVVKYGMDAFLQKVEAEIVDKYGSNNSADNISPLQDHSQTVLPSAARVYISGDGIHNVSATGSGTVGFTNIFLEPIKYTVKFSYRVTVKDGVITNVNGLSASFPTMTSHGEVTETAFGFGFTDSTADGTVTYTILAKYELADYSIIHEYAYSYFTIFTHLT